MLTTGSPNLGRTLNTELEVEPRPLAQELRLQQKPIASTGRRELVAQRIFSCLAPFTENRFTDKNGNETFRLMAFDQGTRLYDVARGELT